MSSSNIAKQITDEMNKKIIEEAKKAGLNASIKNGEINIQGDEAKVKQFMNKMGIK